MHPLANDLIRIGAHGMRDGIHAMKMGDNGLRQDGMHARLDGRAQPALIQRLHHEISDRGVGPVITRFESGYERFDGDGDLPDVSVTQGRRGRRFPAYRPRPAMFRTPSPT